MEKLIFSRLTPTQLRLFRALVALIAFSSAIDLLWQKEFNSSTWYEYQGTEGPFEFVTDNNGINHVGNLPVKTIKLNKTLMLTTNVCFKKGITEEFYRTIIRTEDDEIISTAEHIFGPEDEGCTQIRSVLYISPEWRPGLYEIHRTFVLSNGFLGKLSNYLPVIRLEVTK